MQSSLPHHATRDNHTLVSHFQIFFSELVSCLSSCRFSWMWISHGQLKNGAWLDWSATFKAVHTAVHFLRERQQGGKMPNLKSWRECNITAVVLGILYVNVNMSVYISCKLYTRHTGWTLSLRKFLFRCFFLSNPGKP